MTERDQIRADIKRRLNSYRDLCAESKQITEELERLETLIASPAGPNMGGMPRGGSGVSNPVERLAIKHIEIQERYREQLTRMAEEQARIERMVEGLDSVERRIARFRYIDGLTWEDVCVKMCYSCR